MGFSSRVLSAATEVVAVKAKVVEVRAEENPAAEVVAASIPRRRRDRHCRSPYHSPFGNGRPISNTDIVDDEDLKGLSFTDYHVSKSKKLRSPSPRSGGGGGSSRTASLQVIRASSSQSVARSSRSHALLLPAWFHDVTLIDQPRSASAGACVKLKHHISRSSVMSMASMSPPKEELTGFLLCRIGDIRM